MKKLLASLLIIVTLFSVLCPVCFADDDLKLKDQVKKEKGSLFEKIVAECISGIAETVYNISVGLDVGFKDYDTLIFNNNVPNSSLAPFTQSMWDRIMICYRAFAVISGFLILIAVFILSYKISIAGMNISKKNEAKDSLMRLCFGGVAIALAPMFIKFLLFLNNGFIKLLTTSRKFLRWTSWRRYAYINFYRKCNYNSDNISNVRVPIL